MPANDGIKILQRHADAERLNLICEGAAAAAIAVSAPLHVALDIDTRHNPPLATSAVPTTLESAL